jgi:hypothetical protein
MALTYEPFDTITVSKVNEKLGGGTEAINEELSNLKGYVDASISNLESKIPTNAATQDYVNTTVANYLPLSGGTLTGDINANNRRIYGLPTPISDTDIVNKQYMDSRLTITTQTRQLPQRTIKANRSFNATVTLSVIVPLNKFIGVYSTSNSGLLCNYNLSVNNNNEVEAIYITAYNPESFDITATISFIVQYYA